MVYTILQKELSFSSLSIFDDEFARFWLVKLSLLLGS